MISRRHKKFAKIGRKKRKKRWYMPYIYISIVAAVSYSIASLVVSYYQEKIEFMEDTFEKEKNHVGP